MDPETFAEWLRRQGHYVIRSESSYWYNAGPRVLQAFPYHWQISPSRRELFALLVAKGHACLRFSTPLTSDQGKVSYHIQLELPYSLDLVKAQTRNGVKRGLEKFRTEQITFHALANQGWLLQRDTLERQDRLRSMTQAEWARICLAAEGLPGFEAWGAFRDGELAAALIISKVDDTWCVPYAMSRSKFLSDHVNNALFYTVCLDLLARPDSRKIFFTLQSLDAPPSVDDFKIRMGFAPIPVRQRVVFHPLLMPLANAPIHRLLAGSLARNSGNPLLAKAEGMLRFHLDGRRDQNLQEWPECLLSYKNALNKTSEGKIR